jgi:hypothetical protein
MLKSRPAIYTNQVSRQTDIFHGLCKGDKKSVVDGFFEHQKFVFLHTTKKSQFSVKQLSKDTKYREYA